MRLSLVHRVASLAVAALSASCVGAGAPAGADGFPVVTPPVLVDGDDVTYTPEALAAGARGTVTVRCIITTSGIPVDCLIDSPLPVMEEMVRRAVQTWRFRPALSNDTPIAFEHTLRIPLEPPGAPPISVESHPSDPPSPAAPLEKITISSVAAGATPPKKLSGRNPPYTHAARNARVEGLLTIMCIIELDGRLEDCRVLKPMPFLTRPALDALATHRYTPVLFQGKPVRLKYVFKLRFRLQ